MKTLNELDYDFEIEKIAREIKRQKSKKVLLQFPDGLKPYALEVKKELQKIVGKNIEFFIWLDSCFGACDIPLEVEKLGIDMIVQFGHSTWLYKDKKRINVFS